MVEAVWAKWGGLVGLAGREQREGVSRAAAECVVRPKRGEVRPENGRLVHPATPPRSRPLWREREPVWPTMESLWVSIHAAALDTDPFSHTPRRHQPPLIPQALTAAAGPAALFVPSTTTAALAAAVATTSAPALFGSFASRGMATAPGVVTDGEIEHATGIER